MVEVLRYTAFSANQAAGNPAGVVLDARGLSNVEMQAIAKEVGFSETAFITELGETGRHTVRYFSPEVEVAFCGHATIATAVALAERDGSGDLVFVTLSGDVAVRTSTNPLVATLVSVPGHSHPATADQVDRTLVALGWEPTDIDPNWPAHVSFAGNEHLMLAAANRERLAQLDYDFDALAAIMHEYNWPTINLFWPETPTLVHARNPFAFGGVVEDPATGSAAASFGAYLQSLGRAPERLLIVQGEDMGRRSELTVSITPGNPRIAVSGTAVRLG